MSKTIKGTFPAKLSEEGFKALLLNQNVRCLIDPEGNGIYAFADLVDGMSYTAEPERAEAKGLGKRSRPTKEEWVPSLAKFSPQNLPLYEVDAKAPEFIAPADWLANVKAKVLEEYKIEDTDERRVRPLCVSRCSRGGKTRALKELQRQIKAAGIPLVFVTFNDYSTMDPGGPEQADPLAALLIRIAFIATYGPNGKNFESFRENFEASPTSIETWLGDTNCVLIIDEMNRAESLQKKGEEAYGIFSFLRRVFLRPTNRTLVFSSHVVSTTYRFSDFLGVRGVQVEQLPLIDDFSKAKTLVADLTPQQLLYYNLMPALIHTRDWTKSNAGSVPDLAVNPLTRTSMRRLLMSFITGDCDGVDPRFLPFFDTTSDDDDVRIIWVMRHMYSLLKILGNHFLQIVMDMEMAEQLFDLRRLIGWFRDTKTESGDGFEMLFAFTFLLRVLCGLACEPYFPFGVNDGWSFSFNKFLKTDGRGFDLCCNYSQLRELLLPPKHVTFPHVAFYAPKHARFENYDCFAFFYTTETECIAKAGFQCKAGKATPKGDADTGEFPASFLVRGKPSGVDEEIRGWRFVSEEETENFFGLSGRMWTPSELTALRARLSRT